LLLRSFKQTISDNIRLEQELEKTKSELIQLKESVRIDSLSSKKKIDGLHQELENEKEKVVSLNKSKIKEERDQLLLKIDSLNFIVKQLTDSLLNRDKQIKFEKDLVKITEQKALIRGKDEVVINTVMWYQELSFDELVSSTTSESVSRDILLTGNSSEIRLLLSDLLIYFDSKIIIERKFDKIEVKEALAKLSNINRESKLLNQLKEDIEFYKDFNSELKKIVSDLIILDENKIALEDQLIQKLKFGEIMSLLGNYISNYYDYQKYPYLSEIITEIIKRKQPNADAPITDLLKLL
jgi:hypothetical protein